MYVSLCNFFFSHLSFWFKWRFVFVRKKNLCANMWPKTFMDTSIESRAHRELYSNSSNEYNDFAHTNTATQMILHGQMRVTLLRIERCARLFFYRYRHKRSAKCVRLDRSIIIFGSYLLFFPLSDV